MKKILRKIWFICEKLMIALSRNFRKFSFDKSKKVILIDTPEHGNIGDQAIAIAELNLLKDIVDENHLYEFTHNEYIKGRYWIKKGVREQDTIIIHGGGFIGTIWPHEQEILNQLLLDFCRNKILIMPQTVYFENSKEGDEKSIEFSNIVKKCNDLKILLREKNSYEWMRKSCLFDENKLLLVPDIVTYLDDMKSKSTKDNTILLCMRKDKEKVISHEILEEIISHFSVLNYKIMSTDTVIKKNIKKKARKTKVNEKIVEFSHAKVIITDRLHGMLLASLAGTPCIALDNLSRKVSGVYQWIDYLDYVKCVEANKLSIELVSYMLSLSNCEFTNKPLNEYYETIKNLI